LKKDKPNAALYVHPPFVKEDHDEGQTLTDVVRKYIEEAGNGDPSSGQFIAGSQGRSI
jgi:hypothetical protein